MQRWKCEKCGATEYTKFGERPKEGTCYAYSTPTGHYWVKIN